jgi:murein L,D-transpeptidase YafK
MKDVATNRRILGMGVILKTSPALFAAAALGIFLYAYGRLNQLPANTTIDRILVEKSGRRLSVFQGGKTLKTYRIALGRNPIGPKEEEGDLKTPEGLYRIDGRNPQSRFHLGLHISYPSAEDTARAAARGVSAGCDIMIHGLPNEGAWVGAFRRRTDWTAGCIGLTNEEIEELWRVTPDGTVVEIRP